MVRPHGQAAEGADVRRRHLQGAGPLQEPLRPHPGLPGLVRGGGHLDQAAPRRHRVRQPARAVRGLHARGAVPGVRGRPAQAVHPGGHRRRQEHPRHVVDPDRRRRHLVRRARDQRPGPHRGRPDPQGGQRPPRLPDRRRPHLPVAAPLVGHPRRRRGPADPPGQPDRLGPGGRALRARRAVDRPAPAGQPPPDRDPHPAARPGQHGAGGRARRGHHRRGRLHRRHRPGRRRARRRHRARRLGQVAAQEQELDHRPVPVGQAEDPRAPRAGARPRASGCR